MSHVEPDYLWELKLESEKWRKLNSCASEVLMQHIYGLYLFLLTRWLIFTVWFAWIESLTNVGEMLWSCTKNIRCQYLWFRADPQCHKSSISNGITQREIGLDSIMMVCTKKNLISLQDVEVCSETPVEIEWQVCIKNWFMWCSHNRDMSDVAWN